MNQLTLHKKIDELVKKQPTDDQLSTIKEIIVKNTDSKLYFFSRVGSSWLEWLWISGLMDVIKEKELDSNRFSYKTPELDYLVRCVEDNKDVVFKIMNKVIKGVSKNNLNKEVLDRFIWIIPSLDPNQISSLVVKIRDQKWPRLMFPFNQSSFTYEKIFNKLIEANDFKSLITLADAALALKDHEENSDDDLAKRFSPNNPFYFDDIHYMKVFEYLSQVDDGNLLDALELVTRVMGSIVLAEGKETEDELFKIRDAFSLFDVDFFTVQIGEKQAFSIRDDIRDLAALMKLLTERVIGNKCDNHSREIYSKHVANLPDSQSMWRFKLYAMSLCPNLFKTELQLSFNRIFDKPMASRLVSGTEYCKALKNSFKSLDIDFKGKYIKHVIEYFSDPKKEEWYRRDGLRIISSVIGSVDANQVELIKEETKKKFGHYPNADFEPEPSIGKMRSGYITQKSPVDIETIRSKNIKEIVNLLKGEWAPDAIHKMNKSGDDESFFTPLSSEGLGSLVKTDLKERLPDYIQNAELFFDRKELDAQYTYIFFTGLCDAIKEGKSVASWDHLFKLIDRIIISNSNEVFDNKPRDKSGNDYWIASWTTVHNAIADLIKIFLGDNGQEGKIDFSAYKTDLEKVVIYLLEYKDPDISANTKESGDPFTTAINSVRGKAFQSLVLFVYKNQKIEESNGGITDNIKAAYRKLVESEETFPVMFMVGHYLPSFYYRDGNEIASLLSDIFPESPEKKDLYLASWEGYLATNLYKEIFADDKFLKLYKRAISLNPSSYTKRGYFRKLDEGLATHLALAYMYFDDFTVDSSLFIDFWNNRNEEQHKEFVSFIGRHAISRDRSKEWMVNQKINADKLIKLWDWILGNVTEQKVFKAFGFWMNLEGKSFEIKDVAGRIKLTLEKAKGDIDWEYGLMKTLPDLSREAPSETIDILRMYFTARTNIESQSRGWIYIDDNLVSIFRALYKNHSKEISEKTYNLIDELLPLGNGRFWKLEDAIED